MRLRKLISLLLSVVLLCGLITPVLAEEPEEEQPELFMCGDWQYAVLEDGSAELWLYRGRAGEIMIPDELDGHPVKAANLNPFGNFDRREEYTLTVSENHPYFAVEDNVLYGKSDRKLIAYPRYRTDTSFEIPEGVEVIGSHAFTQCGNLTTVTFPDSVHSIEDFAFFGCGAITDFVIPGSVSVIGEMAFSSCRMLKTVTMLEGVQSIGYKAFSLNHSLETVVIPASVMSIEDGAFAGCDKLTDLSVAADNQDFMMYDGILYRKDGSEMLCCPASFSGELYSFPDGLTKIGNNALYRCTELTAITIPEGVTAIGERAFDGCKCLTAVSIPESVTSIGTFAFHDCAGLTSVVIPDSITSIEGQTFAGCTGLTSVVIPDTVTSIGMAAFSGCSGLTALTIPASVTSIGGSAFYKCPDLVLTVTAGSAAETYCQTHELNYMIANADGE